MLAAVQEFARLLPAFSRIRACGTQLVSKNGGYNSCFLQALTVGALWLLADSFSDSLSRNHGRYRASQASKSVAVRLKTVQSRVGEREQTAIVFFDKE